MEGWKEERERETYRDWEKVENNHTISTYARNRGSYLQLWRYPQNLSHSINNPHYVILLFLFLTTFWEVRSSSPALFSVANRWWLSISSFILSPALDTHVLTPGIRERRSNFPVMAPGFGEVLGEWWCLVRCGARNSGPAGMSARSWQNNNLARHP